MQTTNLKIRFKTSFRLNIAQFQTSAVYRGKECRIGLNRKEERFWHYFHNYDEIQNLIGFYGFSALSYENHAKFHGCLTSSTGCSYNIAGFYQELKP